MMRIIESPTRKHWWIKITCNCKASNMSTLRCRRFFLMMHWNAMFWETWNMSIINAHWVWSGGQFLEEKGHLGYLTTTQLKISWIAWNWKIYSKIVLCHSALYTLYLEISLIFVLVISSVFNITFCNSNNCVSHIHIILGICKISMLVYLTLNVNIFDLNLRF